MMFEINEPSAHSADQDTGNSWDDVPLKDGDSANGLSIVNNHSQDRLASPKPQSTIKPYVQALSPLDLDSCVKLEELTFPPQERCSREKFEYRFASCGELSLGLFTSADTTLATATSDKPRSAVPGSAGTASTAVPVYSGTPDRKSILLGHVIATKTTNPLVRDEDMDIPPEWRKSSAESMLSAIEPSGGSATAKDGPVPGHKEHGRTLCVHSLSVLPDFQGQGLGRLLMTSYMQRMRSAGVADRIAIISHEALVPFYESLGFETQGQSPVQFGGGGWTDMVYHLNPDGP